MKTKTRIFYIDIAYDGVVSVLGKWQDLKFVYQNRWAIDHQTPDRDASYMVTVKSRLFGLIESYTVVKVTH